jgi:membrane protein implicated in regulation of membrane protease activity
MQEIGKLLFVAGLVMAAVGLLLWKTGGLGVIGRLPGDISVQRPGFSFYFPITTCIVISIVLTLLMWLFRR